MRTASGPRSVISSAFGFWRSRTSQELHDLQRRAIALAERLVADRLVIVRVDRVGDDHADAGRLDVPALLEPRPQPEPLLGELARRDPVIRRDEDREAGVREALGLVVHGERRPLATVPVLPHDALAGLPRQPPHGLVLLELVRGDGGLLGRHRAKPELLLEVEVEIQRIVRRLADEAEVHRRRLLGLGRERLEDRVLGACDLCDVRVLEVVERQHVADVAIVLAIAERDRAQRGRAQPPHDTALRTLCQHEHRTIGLGKHRAGRLLRPRKLTVPDWDSALVSSWKPSSSPAPGSAPRGAERPRWRHFLPSKYSNASTSCSLGLGRGMMLESDSCISIEMYASAVCRSSSHAR